MRGVSTWSVATRKDGEIAVESFPVVSWTRRSRVLRWPVIRGVVALGQSMSIGFKALEISANAQAARGRGADHQGAVGVHDRRRARARRRPLLRRPGRAHQPDQGLARTPSLLFWLVEGVRPHRDLPRLPDAALAPEGPAPRSSSTTAPSTRSISCYEAGLPLTPANAQRFSPPAPALRHELPARGDDRRHLRLRPGRPAGLVHRCSPPA